MKVLLTSTGKYQQPIDLDLSNLVLFGLGGDQNSWENLHIGVSLCLQSSNSEVLFLHHLTHFCTHAHTTDCRAVG